MYECYMCTAEELVCTRGTIDIFLVSVGILAISFRPCAVPQAWSISETTTPLGGPSDGKVSASKLVRENRAPS